MEALTLEPSGRGKALAVFGHREEAELFLRLEGLEDRWRVRESAAGEIVSLLFGPCAGASGVALDPLPEMVGGPTLGLVTLGRERFAEHLL